MATPQAVGSHGHSATRVDVPGVGGSPPVEIPPGKFWVDKPCPTCPPYWRLPAALRAFPNSRFQRGERTMNAPSYSGRSGAGFRRLPIQSEGPFSPHPHPLLQAPPQWPPHLQPPLVDVPNTCADGRPTFHTDRPNCGNSRGTAAMSMATKATQSVSRGKGELCKPTGLVGLPEDHHDGHGLAVSTASPTQVHADSSCSCSSELVSAI